MARPNVTVAVEASVDVHKVIEWLQKFDHCGNDPVRREMHIKLIEGLERNTTGTVNAAGFFIALHLARLGLTGKDTPQAARGLLSPVLDGLAGIDPPVSQRLVEEIRKLQLPG